MPARAAYDALVKLAGVGAGRVPHFEGDEAVLPTPFRAGTAAAVALGLSAAFSGEIRRLRGGAAEGIAVDVRHAAASLLSFALLTLDGKPMERPGASEPTTAFYPTGCGRWIHLHGGFPHLAHGTVELLNAEHTHESIAEACLKWNAFALEDALAHIGLCGAVARTESEWRRSPPGQALEATPPVVIERIGNGPRLTLEGGPRPLSDVRVLDLTHVLAGPTAGRTLASYGADVLHARAPDAPRIDLFDIDTGLGKRSTFLDLRRPRDAEAARALLRDAHVFVQSYRPGALARLGFSSAALAHLVPGLVYVTVSCYGENGPWADRGGWEQLAQSATGLAHDQGGFEHARNNQRRDTSPVLVPAALCDYVTGYLAAAGAAAALLRRMREGGSWRVRVSLSATAMWLQSLGRIEADAVPARFAGALDEWFASCETTRGRLVHLKSPVRMEGVGWDLPPPVPGSYAAQWVTT